MISSVEFSISLPYARFGCDTLSASGGLVFTLYVLLISVIIAEILCLAVFQIIASIVSQTQRFYSEYEWLDSFMIGSTIDALEETTPPTLDSETIESALITLKVRTDQFANKKEELDQIQQCAICLCDYELNESISRSKSCQHTFHTSCYKQWLARDRHRSCPYCRCDIFKHAAKTIKGSIPKNHDSSNAINTNIQRIAEERQLRESSDTIRDIGRLDFFDEVFDLYEDFFTASSY